MKPESFETKVSLVVSPSGVSGSSVWIDEGVVQLCRTIKNLGSLNKAAKELRIPYSRAWRTLRRLELAFDIQLMDSDGPRGSVLTENAVRLVHAYESAQESARRAAQESFEAALSR